jgi:hypothetical protein
MATPQPKSRMTMDDILDRRRGRKWAFWTFDEMRQMTPEQWLTACCPMAAVDCPAVVDEDDELICSRCRGTR